MNIKQLGTLQQVADFVHASASLEPLPATQAQRYRWIEETLRRFDYARLPRPDKGLVVAYLGRITGYSRQQLTRLIHRYRECGRLRWTVRPTNGFAGRFTEANIRLLAEIDALHDTPLGANREEALRTGLEPLWRCPLCAPGHHLGLASVQPAPHGRLSHPPPRLRQDPPGAPAIATRRKPDPQGQPGFIRIDTVHQGEQDGRKGLYHVNAVDQITQFEVLVTVERISEQFLIPALEALLGAFPFVIKGFHPDNGSEYINRRVAALLEKLRIEFTKSRPRRCNDNALAESKNGSVVRKFLGYSHIPQRSAGAVNRFNADHLTPYLNYHRPCYFPTTVIDEKGKQRKRYRYEDMMTPYEKLKSLPDAEQYLRPGLSFASLDATAYTISDNEAAKRLQAARHQLFETIFERRHRIAYSPSFRLIFGLENTVSPGKAGGFKRTVRRSLSAP